MSPQHVLCKINELASCLLISDVKPPWVTLSSVSVLLAQNCYFLFLLTTGVLLQSLSHAQQPPKVQHLAEEHNKVQVTICTKRGVSHLHLIFLSSLYNELTC